MSNVKDTEGASTSVGQSIFAVALQAPTRILTRLKGVLSRKEKQPDQPGTEVAIGRSAPPLTPARPFDEDDNRNEEVISWAGRAMLVSFLMMVLIPTLAAGAYYGFWASSAYVSDTHVSVRIAAEQKQSLQGALDALKNFLPGPKASSQDSQIVLDYIRSKAIVEDIGGAAYLETIYTKNNIDYFSRMNTKEPIETAWKYWQSHVLASLDTRAGIVHIKVFAYTPQDAHALASRIVEASEQLVNSVSTRSRLDAVAQSRSEVEGAQGKLVNARTAVLDFRNRKRIIDPASKGEDIGKIMVGLEMQRIQFQNVLAGFGESLNADSPSVRTLRSQIAQLDKQLAGLKEQLTSTDSRSNALSDDLADFERLKLNEHFAEKFHQMTMLAHERALQESQRQQFYLATVVRPTMPQSSLYPERTTNTLMFFLGLFVIWGILCMLFASVLDHLT